MTLLLGDQTIRTSARVFSKEVAIFTRWEATATGTVETFEFYVQKIPAGHTLEFGIYADSGEVPTTLLEHKELKPEAQENKWLVNTGWKTKVTKGTHYWLAVEDPGTTFSTSYETLAEGTENKLFRVAKTNHAHMVASPEVEPFAGTVKSVSIAAVGTEEAAVTAQCKVQVLMAGSARAQQQQQGKATVAIQVVGKDFARQIQQARAEAAARNLATSTSQSSVQVGLLATYEFADRATVQVMTRAQALARLVFEDANAPTAIVQAQATAKIIVASNASAQQVQQAAGRARLVFAGEANIKAEGGEARRVALFIYEDDEDGYRT